MRDMRREMGDMQAELLALRGQSRRAEQPEGDARVPNHQDAPRDADYNTPCFWVIDDVNKVTMYLSYFTRLR
uniref:Uncharacterized protein n=1 Tax=Tanacetum cinerariifolium TaxID=118510 RepID=A0A699VYN2_TANCI|nr:hypothetical protein [Tanacetum cinerariifolium]